jgi:hypothetical protein
MPKEVMRRKAADNPYLHKDFHGALSAAIEYLHQRFGPQAVREYLRQFAAAFYKPLTDSLKARGLAALKEHFERIYALEGAAVEIRLSDDELVIRVAQCPAVTHMRANGYPVARLFEETTRTVNEALCEGTPYAAELVEYQPQDGRSVQRFFRRKT